MSQFTFCLRAFSFCVLQCAPIVLLVINEHDFHLHLHLLTCALHLSITVCRENTLILFDHMNNIGVLLVMCH